MNEAPTPVAVVSFETIQHEINTRIEELRKRLHSVPTWTEELERLTAAAAAMDGKP